MKYSYAFSVAILPRDVLLSIPIWIKYGSYISSIVDTSSPTEVASVSIPTGPPLNFSIIVKRSSLSVSSGPILSIFNLSNAFCVTSRSIVLFPSTKAKSLTRLNSLLAILGVPLLLTANSLAASSSISVSKTLLVLFTICVSSSSVYYWSLLTIPNLSLSGDVRSPALVVAPTSVNGGRSIFIFLVDPSVPIMISKEKSSIAG